MMGDQRYFGKGHSRAPDTERGGVALSAGGSCQPATLQHFETIQSAASDWPLRAHNSAQGFHRPVWGEQDGSQFCEAVFGLTTASFFAGCIPCRSINKRSSNNRSKSAASLQGTPSMLTTKHSGRSARSGTSRELVDKLWVSSAK